MFEEPTKVSCIAQLSGSANDSAKILIPLVIAIFSEDFVVKPPSQSVQLTSDQPKVLEFSLSAKHSGLGKLTIETDLNGDRSAAYWPTDVDMKLLGMEFTILLLGSAFAFVFFEIASSIRQARLAHAFLEAATEKKVAEAESKVEKSPEKAKFAWDLARLKLEAYFDRNLYQVDQIFKLSVAVMIVGFLLVGGAVIASINQSKVTLQPSSLQSLESFRSSSARLSW